MTHASLFSGIGGFELAAQWAGFENIFNCEIDTFCRKILKYHFLNENQYSNIRTTDFRKYRGKIDILTGGFPCQPFSVAGQRKGADDDRYLWDEMLRAIREIKPAWVIGENVAGILTMVQPGETIKVGSEADLFGTDYTIKEKRERYVIDTICSDLEREGYAVQPFVIPACAVGAPHRRDRVWIIANRADTGAENLQPGRQNGVCEIGITSDTESIGRHERSATSGRIKNNKTERADIFKRTNRFSEKQSTTYPAITGLQRGVHCGKQAQTWNANNIRLDVARLYKQGVFAYTDQCGRTQDKQDVKTGQFEQNTPNWREFPTQSPVCSRDDGISDELDGITFPAWRRESIKSYGNAIVPEVVFEIFKAIKRIENI